MRSGLGPVLLFVVGGVVMFTPNATKRKEIADANTAKNVAGKAATAENERKTRAAFVTVTLAPLIAAPEGSTTVPARVAVFAPCA